MADFTLRGRIIDINNFKTDIFDNAIEDSHIDFEITRDGKGELITHKEFSYGKWNQWQYIIYNYFVIEYSLVIQNSCSSD